MIDNRRSEDLIAAFAQERMPKWREIRRDFHHNPELGLSEIRTATIISRHLIDLGYEVRIGKQVADLSAVTGRPSVEIVEERRKAALAELGEVPEITIFAGEIPAIVAELNRGEGPITAYRFDIDALPIFESDADDHNPKREGFRSINDGVMHACGHDGHTTIGLGVAEWLVQSEANWSGTVRLIFQPAEEGGRGALPMMKAGVVDDVDYFAAAHLGNNMPTGLVAARATEIFFATKFRAHFKGRSAHAAGDPQQGRNAILAAAAATLNLHAISRHSSSDTRVNVGRIAGGQSHNVIADTCMIEVEVRALSEEAWLHMKDRAKTIVASAATMHEVEVSTEHLGDAVGAESDNALADMVADVAQTIAGVEKVVPSRPNGGGEDATYFMRRVQERGGQACYFLIGATLADKHHTPKFDFDEDGIRIGMEIFARLAEKISRQCGEKSK